MTKLETITVCLAIVAATVAASLGSLTPPLVGLLGVAVGYGGGRTVGSIPTGESKR